VLADRRVELAREQVDRLLERGEAVVVIDRQQVRRGVELVERDRREQVVDPLDPRDRDGDRLGWSTG
jgi:hypothetical protein